MVRGAAEYTVYKNYEICEEGIIWYGECSWKEVTVGNHCCHYDYHFFIIIMLMLVIITVLILIRIMIKL